MKLTRAFSIVSATAAVVVSPVLADTIAVSGQANIFGAGIATPPGGGQAPPVVSIPVQPGSFVEFSSITGLVQFASSPSFSTGPEGTNGESRFDSQGGISGWRSPRFIFLAGVFLGADAPTLPAPPSLDFVADGISFSELSPSLQQTFFIGDGLTGSGSGAVQRFHVPSGATRLFLGIGDGSGVPYFGPNPGSYHDNSGQWNVEYSVVPEPASLSALMLAGLVTLRRRR